MQPPASAPRPASGVWGGNPQSSLPRRLLKAMRLWRQPQQAKDACPASLVQTSQNGGDMTRDETNKNWGWLQVALHKPVDAGASSLGISLSGGGEHGLCPRVAAVRPGSVAHASDLLTVGDYVAAVNGVRTERLRAEQVAALLQRAEPGPVSLELQYELPPPSPSVSEGCSKIVHVSLQRDETGSLGFTIRGGSQSDPSRSRTLLITQVREGGPADRSGCVRPGDRLMAIDGVSMLGASLNEAHDAIRRDPSGSALVRLSLEVDTAPGAPNLHGGPLLIELERVGGDPALGLALAAAVGGGVVIAGVRPGSLADRCGALSLGDQVLAVGGARVEEGTGPMETAQLLAQCGPLVQIETLPQFAGGAWGSLDTRGLFPPRLGSASSFLSSSGHSTLTSQRGGRMVRKTADSLSTFHESSSNCGCHSAHAPPGVSHSESLTVTLLPDTCGYGLSLEGACPPVIAAVEPNSPADQSGCLQPGDRLVLANQVPCEGFSGPEAMLLLNDGSPALTLLVQFDVAEAVVPTSGVFTVKLARRGTADLGIFLSAPKVVGSRAPVISEIRRGSVAHRSGALQAGDQLLEVGGARLGAGEEAAKVLLGAARQEVVTLRVLKGTRTLREASAVVYSVELARLGGPLGLTIAGTEEAFHPITISALTPGGLAERTGALHVGDRLLSINGHCLEGRRLSEAIDLLQGSGDRVTLEISRPCQTPGDSSRRPQTRHGPASPGTLTRHGPANPSSVDSAVESWSSGVEHGPGSPGGGAGESATVRRRPTLPAPWDSESRDSSADSGQSGGSCPAVPEGWDVRQIVSGSLGESLEEGDEEGDEGEVFAVAPPRCGTLPSRRGGSSTPSCLPDVYQVTLYKDRVYEDFGFSVSDGLYERGVYINRIRRGGPADMSGRLRPFDRILQVNETRTLDFDCCLTVPLIAAAGDSLELTVARNPFALLTSEQKEESGLLPWLIEEVEEVPRGKVTVTKTL